MEHDPPRPLARWNPIRDVWEQETWQDSLLSEPSDVFSGTWPASGMTRSGVAYVRPTSGSATAASGSSSSLGLLPTPTAYLGTCGGPQPPEKRRAGGHQVHLHDVILHLFPTPTARDWRDGEEPPLGRGADELAPWQDDLAPAGGIRPASWSCGACGGLDPDCATCWLDLTVDHGWGDFEDAIRSHEQLLGRTAPPAMEPGPLRGTPRLSVRFAEWLMALPDGWVVNVPGLTRTQQLTMLGNGVVPPQAAYALEDMLACIPAGVAAA